MYLVDTAIADALLRRHEAVRWGARGAPERDEFPFVAQ